MVSLIYCGAEVPSNKQLLVDQGITRVGVSFFGLRNRVRKSVDALLTNFSDDCEIHAYAGSVGKRSPDEIKEMAQEYEQFIEANVDRLASWMELDDPSLGADWVRSRREHFYDKFDPTCFRPVWGQTLGPTALTELCRTYPQVLIKGEDLPNMPGLAGLLATLRSQYGTQFHVLHAPNLGDLKEPGSPAFVDAYTSMWTRPMRNGETIVWFNNRLVRYPAKMKDEARAKHRKLFADIGLDVDKIDADKPAELSKLAIWSLDQFEKSALHRPSLTVVSTTNTSDQELVKSDSGTSGDDTSTPDVRNSAPRKRHPSERAVIPSMATEVITATQDNGDGTITLSESTVVRSPAASLRQCDTCFIATACPQYQPQTECAFHFPVEIRSSEQVIGVLQTVMEVQADRIAFARMAEEINGGYPDPTVGKEMDRLLRQVALVKDLQENREFVRLSVERRSSGGVLSAIFGDRAAQALMPKDVSDT